MPLDLGQTHLADLASWLGITPVSEEVLERHKREEVAKRPGDWLYHHHSVIPMAFFVIFVAAGASLMAALCAMKLSMWLFALGLVAMTIGAVIVMARLNDHRALGPAKWYEQTFTVPLGELHNYAPLAWTDAPASIQRVAYRILEHSTGDMKVVYGTLVQDSKIVDPYLTIRRGDQQIIIGIWDHTGIVAEAQEA